MRVLIEYSFYWRDKTSPLSISGVSRIVSRSKSEALGELKEAFRTALYQWKDITIERVEERPWAVDNPAGQNPAGQNPYSNSAEYWHFRVEDPQLFQKKSFRTIDIPGHPGRGKFVIGKLAGKKTTSIQKVMISKSFRPDPGEAEAAAKHMLDGVGPRNNPANPPGGRVEEDPEEDEMPLIYGRVHRITMTKTAGDYKGQRFYHNFGEGVTLHGVPEGTMLVLPSGRLVRLERRSGLLQGPKGLWGHYS